MGHWRTTGGGRTFVWLQQKKASNHNHKRCKGALATRAGLCFVDKVAQELSELVCCAEHHSRLSTAGSQQGRL